MTAPPFARPLAVLRGPVSCRRTPHALILTGLAGEPEQAGLILTFLAAKLPDVPDSLAAAEVLVLDERHYRIVAAEGSWELEASSVHVHRDIAAAFYRAIPPRQVPLRKRLFWRIVLALAGTRPGKRLLFGTKKDVGSR